MYHTTYNVKPSRGKELDIIFFFVSEGYLGSSSSRTDLSIESINVHNMKKFVTILGLVLLLGFMCTSTQAQTLVRKGNNFTVVSDARKTNYTYTDRNGVTYPIYISPKGKAFIVKTSRKTGKKYRQYIKRVTDELAKIDVK